MYIKGSNVLQSKRYYIVTCTYIRLTAVKTAFNTTESPVTCWGQTTHEGATEAKAVAVVVINSVIVVILVTTWVLVTTAVLVIPTTSGICKEYTQIPGWAST